MRFGTLAAASTIALTVAFKASGAEVVDSINNYNIINENLSYYCISNKDSDVLKCTAAQMESAEALSTGKPKNFSRRLNVRDWTKAALTALPL